MEEKKMEMIKESDRTPCPISGGGGGGADVVEDENEEDEMVFPGFRFHPTDQELVGFYLTRKVEKKAFSIDIIKEVDIYKHDPWDLPKARHGLLMQGSSSSSSSEKECYFFCLRGRKYRNSVRPNRVTASGFWKATGIDKPIYPSNAGASAGAGDCIGLKKSLVYYRGSAGRGTKTDWMMHEFRLPSSPSPSPAPGQNHQDSFQDAEIWTICRIFKRSFMSTYSKRSFAPGTAMISSNNKQSHHRHHHQLLQYYHHGHYTCSSSSSASMATPSSSSVEYYSTSDAGRAVHAIHHQYLLDFHAVTSTSSAAVSVAASASAAAGWSDEPVSFRDGGSSWDELGRIMEISTDSSN